MNETLFFLQIKKFINYIKGYDMAKKSFVVEVTFKYKFKFRFKFKFFEVASFFVA